LRASVERIERAGAADQTVRVSLGDARLDALLPGGGLGLGGLHQVVPGRLEWDDGPAAGFIAGLLGRALAASAKPALWVARRGDLHLPGLADFGIAPERLLLAKAGSETALFWALEEALASGALAGVVGESEALDRVAGRRLQLAAEAAACPCFLLQRRSVAARRAEPPSPALTRWRVTAAPSDSFRPPDESGRARWRVNLERNRGGGRFAEDVLLEWSDAPGGFSVVAGLRDGAADAPRRAG
jgi:protein ImuA